MAIAVKDIIPKFLNQKLDWQESLMQRWPSIVGSLQTRIRLEKIYDATVVIGVYESHWMQELFLLSSVIVDSINTFLGEQKIQAVRFVLVEERPRPTRWSYKAKRSSGSARKISLNDAQTKALAGVSDAGLREALMEFLGRTQRW